MDRETARLAVADSGSVHFGLILEDAASDDLPTALSSPIGAAQLFGQLLSHNLLQLVLIHLKRHLSHEKEVTLSKLE